MIPRIGYKLRFPIYFAIAFGVTISSPPSLPAAKAQPITFPSGYILPFTVGETWYFTNGPHNYNNPGARPWSAIDIAPLEVIPCPGGATPANRWVVAANSGTVVESSQGLAIIDHGDGWRTYYSHIAATDRRPPGQIAQGERVGHPSCEVEPGGRTTGVHVHFAICRLNATGGGCDRSDRSGLVNISGLTVSGWLIQEGAEEGAGTMTREGVTRTRSLGRVNGTNDIRNSGSGAPGTPGTILRTINVNPAPSCPGPITVGIAFDGSELLVSCIYHNVLTRVSPANGANLGSYTIQGISPSEGIGALSWDRKNNQLWLASAWAFPQRVYTATLNKVAGTGTASLRFTHTRGGISLIDGLAFDGTDNSVWFSPDVDQTVYHYSQTGTLLGSFSIVSKLGGYGNSGIVAADANTLYLANNGGSQIYSANKNGTSTAFFASLGGKRVEDLECDGITFSPKSVIWSKDAYDWELNAFEVPPGQCLQGGVPVFRGFIASVDPVTGNVVVTPLAVRFQCYYTTFSNVLKLEH